jgi:urease accessory protein
VTDLDLAFERRGERTVLTRRVYRWPFVVMRPFRLDSAPAHMSTVIVQSSSGALQRGDRLTQRIAVGLGAAAHVTTQGATAVHEAGQDRAEERVSLHVARQGVLEYMPEPRVLFAGAELRSELELECAEDGVALIADAFSWHDPHARGRFPRRLCATTTIRIAGGDPVSIERMDIRNFASGGDYAAFGGLTAVAPGRLGLDFVDVLNPALSRVDGLYAAASILPADAGVIVRFAGRDLRALRAGVALAWEASRMALFGASPGRRRKG